MSNRSLKEANLTPSSGHSNDSSNKLLLSHKPGFQPFNEELSYWTDDVSGTIPDDLTGTVFRVGPGRLEIGDQKYGHFFDGDGMITAFSFSNGRVHFQNKYVRTRKYIAESKANKILYRGLGTQRPGGFLANAFRAPENVANTSLVYHADKLLALWEGGKPFEINPGNLDTKGLYKYDNALSGLKPFSAHGKINPITKEYINFGIQPGASPKLLLYKISTEGKIISEASYATKLPYFCHDFALTENYAVFFLGPLLITNPFAFLFGFKSIGELIKYVPEKGTRVVVFSLKEMKVVHQETIDPFIVIHFGNAFERGNTLLIDLFQYDNWDVNDFLRNPFDNTIKEGGDLFRYEIDLNDGNTNGRVFENAARGDFPNWNWNKGCQPYQYLYSTIIMDNSTPYFFNGIQKIDLDTGKLMIHDCGPGRFTSEALFVPKSNASSEDDGYLVAIVYDAQKDKSEVLILDAKNLNSVLATVQLKHYLPYSFHGIYVPKLFIEA